ncbi:class IV adenylate cyclase [Nonomuraea zeae]|uniref:Class IV adenylate cyclase n=1 Tax=Nonomuraea zeae TaxID=1642303 RepID=A0A5S4FTM5_9ACTN|nr:class IV adenylate cyclase [Nonomuraea zeae]TMR24127.1 class IV adenylate cyclase [Nonomuraea zeae]
MPIEAELKAVVRDPARVRAALRERADEQLNVYRDVYYDTPDRRHSRDGREIRLRVVDGTRSLLTYKDPVVDRDSGSKPEYETAVADPVAMDAVLRKLGLEEVIRYEKRCANYRLERSGLPLLATLVAVPELAGTFLEVEAVVEPAAVPAALRVVRQVLAELGIGGEDLTTELYTEAVRRVRSTTLDDHGRT